LRLLAEHDEALNHRREHQPRTSAVGLTTASEQRALFIQDCEGTATIASIGHLAKKRSGAKSLERALSFEAAGGLGMQ
jgi:hypothetical protein